MFRAAGGPQVGYGHVRRCLTLADELTSGGAECSFVLDEAELSVSVESSGFAASVSDPRRDVEITRAVCQAANCRVLVVDSYAWQTEHFRGVRQGGDWAVVALDDCGDRHLPVDLIVNGSAGAEHLAYACSGSGAHVLSGARYALLRRQFSIRPVRRYRGVAQRVLITAGGGDPQNLTPAMIGWAAQACPTACLDVLIGPLFRNLEAIEAAARALPQKVSIRFGCPDMRELMLCADVALCCGGQTLYELAATGTPAVAVRLAENQTQNLVWLEEAGAIVWAGDAQDPSTPARAAASLTNLVRDPALRRRMGSAAAALVDGQGAARVASAIAGLGAA